METSSCSQRAVGRLPFGFVVTWASGLASVWGLVEGLLEAVTLILGCIIGVLTVLRQLRELGRLPEPPSHER